MKAALLKFATLSALTFSACSPTPQPTTVPDVVGRIDYARTLPTTSTDISLRVGSREVPATVVAPSVKGPWPSILLLAGSGPTDRDWNSPLLPAKNGSGKLLAEAMAARGAVVIRIDKAGTGKNPGPPDVSSWSLDTYRDEGMAALDHLASRADVRRDAGFVAGHSEGGIHATRLAASAGARVRGVIYLSAASRSMAATMLTQVENQLRNPLAMLAAAQVEAEMRTLRAAFADFIEGKAIDPTKASSIPQLQQLVASITDPRSARLSRALIAFDNAAEAPSIESSFLVVSGAKDIQIDELDARRLANALRAAKRDVTVEVLANADHVFKTEAKSLEELRANLVAVQYNYNAADRVLDPDVVRVMSRWIAAHSLPAQTENKTSN